MAQPSEEPQAGQGSGEQPEPGTEAGAQGQEPAAPGTQPAQAASEQPAPGPKAKRPRSSGPMATVALRGEQAERLRALAAAHGMNLTQLLLRMMDVFEAEPQ